jgi:hypothetical protein
MIPSSVERVPQHTCDSVNAEIRHQTERNVERFRHAGRVAIDRRLAELDREWDIERTLEANAAALSLVGLGLGATINRKWYILPAAVASFLLQHAIQGWCPPLPVLRRMGFRTVSEIDYERYALKAMRGDFQNLSKTRSGKRPSAEQVVEAMT